MQKLFDDFVAFWRNFFALREYGYSFHHFCCIMGCILSDMGGILGPKF